MGEVLTQQAVNVFVDTALPGSVGIGEVDLDAGTFSQDLVPAHLPPAVEGEAEFVLGLGAVEHVGEAVDGGFGCGSVDPGKQEEQGGAIHAGNGGLALGALLSAVGLKPISN